MTHKVRANDDLEAMRTRLEHEAVMDAFQVFLSRFSSLSPEGQERVVNDISIRTFRRCWRRRQPSDQSKPFISPLSPLSV